MIKTVIIKTVLNITLGTLLAVLVMHVLVIGGFTVWHLLNS